MSLVGGLAVVAVAEADVGGVAFPADVPSAGGTFAAVVAAATFVDAGTGEAAGAAADVAGTSGIASKVGFAGSLTGGVAEAGAAVLASSGDFTSGALETLTAESGTVIFADVS